MHNYNKKSRRSQNSRFQTFQEFLEFVAQKTGYEPKRGYKGYLARCPAHDDNHPSMGISEGDEGRILIHCHCGCTYKEICYALEIKERDLFIGKGGYHG